MCAAAFAAAFAGCGRTTSEQELDSAIPPGLSEEEKPYFVSVAAFVRLLPPDPVEVDDALMQAVSQQQSPEERARFLLAVLRLQMAWDAQLEDQTRMTAAWSAARRLLVDQGPVVLRPVIEAIRRTGGGIPGIEEVLIQNGPAAARVLEDFLKMDYPPRDDPAYAADVAARGVLIHALGKIADPTTRPILERIFRNDPAPTVRFSARQALVQMRDQRIVNIVCRSLRLPNDYWSTFSRHLLIEIYDVAPPYRDYGRDAAKWLAAFDSAYYRMKSPVRKLLECLAMPPVNDDKKIPASEFARRILAELTGRDLGPDPAAWEAHFRREDEALVRLLVEGLADESPVNRDAVREDLVRLTGGLNFGLSADAWRQGLVDIGYFAGTAER